MSLVTTLHNTSLQKKDSPSNVLQYNYFLLLGLNFYSFSSFIQMFSFVNLMFYYYFSVKVTNI